MPKRVLSGVVVSDVNAQTVTVLVERTYQHLKYRKTVKSSKKYAAHDPNNTYKVGDNIKIVECRPFSKSKKWHVVEDEKLA